MLWHELGFRDNPYSTAPVPPSDEGLRLLVGREAELDRLRMTITSSANHTTIEGANGVGKTSLVGIAGFTLFRSFLQQPSINPLYIPAQTTFQLQPETTAEMFSERFMLSLARELIVNRSLLEEHRGSSAELYDLERWLNQPIITGGGGGVNILGSGFSANVAHAANTGQGFARGGVDALLRPLMEKIFPNSASGGVICVLDNLELLDTSARARATLEALRDGVFAFPGVKWVLCGARGIIRSVVSTPRLQGKLTRPMDLAPLTASQVKTVIERRLEIFRSRDDSYTPVDAEGFSRIYEIGNHNLRVALKFCEDFVFWCVQTGNRPENAADKLSLIDTWFAEEAQLALNDTSDVGARAWQVFDGIGNRPEGISQGEFESLGFNNPQALQPHLRSLEQAALIESSTDETDKRRKTVTMTPRGWIVRYQRREYKL